MCTSSTMCTIISISTYCTTIISTTITSNNTSIASTIGVNNTTSNSIDISEKGGEKLINLKFW